jgi:DNA-binding SARP family transcriptional activator
MEEAVEVARAFGAERELGIALNCLAATLIQQDERDRAVTLLHESLAAFRHDPQHMFAARSLELLGGIAGQWGAVEDAATLFGAGDAIRRAIAATPFKADGEWIARHLAEGRAAIGPEAFDRAMAAGQAMSLGQAIDFALSRPRLVQSGSGATDRPAAQFTGEYAIEPQAGAGAHGTLRVRALGSLEIHLDGAPMPATAWSYAKPRELLLFLLCHPEGRTREQVGLALWPDASSAQLRNNFHVTLHHLRRVLGGPRSVQLERGRYRLSPDRAVDFDATWFEAAASSALHRDRRGEPAIEPLREAVARYGGEFLEGAAVGDWHLEVRDRLQRLHTDALLALGNALLRADRADDAAVVLERLVHLEPLGEAGHRALMFCRARLGDHSGALQQYHRLTRTLRAELGARPGSESAALFHRLQQGQPV